MAADLGRHDAGARKAAPAKTAKPKRAPVKKAKRKVKQPVDQLQFTKAHEFLAHAITSR
jgi:hypothetical protein